MIENNFIFSFFFLISLTIGAHCEFNSTQCLLKAKNSVHSFTSHGFTSRSLNDMISLSPPSDFIDLIKQIKKSSNILEIGCG
jgi:hypothetical protein